MNSFNTINCGSYCLWKLKWCYFYVFVTSSIGHLECWDFGVMLAEHCMWWEEQGWLLVSEMLQSTGEVSLRVQERKLWWASSRLTSDILAHGGLVWDCCGRPQVLLLISGKNDLLEDHHYKNYEVNVFFQDRNDTNVELSSNLLLLDFRLRWTEHLEIIFLDGSATLQW